MGETFEKVVAAIRQAEAKGVSRYEISKRSGVSQSVLGRMVNGDRQDVETGTADRILEAISLELRIVKKKKAAGGNQRRNQST